MSKPRPRGSFKEEALDTDAPIEITLLQPNPGKEPGCWVSSRAFEALAKFGHTAAVVYLAICIAASKNDGCVVKVSHRELGRQWRISRSTVVRGLRVCRRLDVVRVIPDPGRPSTYVLPLELPSLPPLPERSN